MPPDGFSDLVNLKNLYLNNNQIKEIPDGFSNFVNLQNFILSNNQIKEIPDGFSNLVNLKNLYLNNNQIKKIPISLINLRNLRIFHYDNNEIENVNPIIQRFLNRINNQGGNIHNVYIDGQNVHTSSIQNCIKKSIIKIFSSTIYEYI